MNNFGILENLSAIGVDSFAVLIAGAIMALSLVLTLLVIVIKLRGQDGELIAICTRDALLGCTWALTLFGFPVAFYLMGRAFWRAATWHPASTS